MAPSGKQWLKGCGIGCGTALVLAILAVVIAGTVMMKPMDRALTAQKDLSERFGAREAYLPPPEGLTADQLDRFLQVRRDLAPHCAAFGELAEPFQAMDEMAEQEDKPRPGTLLKNLGSLTGSVLGLVGHIGGFIEARNEALQARDMGLGEYMWIYTLAYYSYLGRTPRDEFTDEEAARPRRGEAGIMRTLLQNYAGVLQAGGREHDAQLWRQEAEKLQRAGGAVPFAGGGLPADLADLLQTRRAELEETFCAALSTYEFGEVEKRGLSVHSR